MRKFLLIGINAKYIHSNPAIYSIQAYAQEYYRQKNWTLTDEMLELAEYTINQNKESILADIYHRKPDIVAFSCYIWNWKLIQELLDELPKLLPKLFIWLGGPEVSFHGERILLEYPQVTGIMIGEGEATCTELLTFYQTCEGRLSDIAGLFLREGSTASRELLDVKKIPFLYKDLGCFQNRIIYYESQRGCPFRCAYCLSSIDKKIRLRDSKETLEHLQFFLDHKVPQVKFIDRTFNCNKPHAMAIWQYIKEHDNGVTNFHFEIAADLLTEEELEIISDMRPGLIQLEIGVQSTNETTLRAINRFAKIDVIRLVTAKIRGFRNIHQHLDLIAGLPFEDYISFAVSFNEVYEMKPQQLQLGFLKVLKGSPIEEKVQEYGIVYSSTPPYEVLYTKWLSYDDVIRLKRIEEMVELYYNSGQFSHTLPVLEQEFESPFSMYEALAQYYQEKGYFVQSPARAYRYQILLEFALQNGVKSGDRETCTMYQQLLTFDLYLRENIKSRPAFLDSGRETQREKDYMHQFYKQEEVEPKLLAHYQGFKAAQLAKMTHMERWDYPVWEENATLCRKKLEHPVYLLFDYRKRDALTYDAAYYQVNYMEEEVE